MRVLAGNFHANLKINDSNIMKSQKPKKKTDHADSNCIPFFRKC